MKTKVKKKPTIQKVSKPKESETPILDLLRVKKRWTKNYMAKTVSGAGVSFSNPSAVKFCLVGAMYRCYGFGNNGGSKRVKRINNKLLAALKSLGKGRDANGHEIPLTTWNDARTTKHRDIVEVLEKAKV